MAAAWKKERAQGGGITIIAAAATTRRRSSSSSSGGDGRAKELYNQLASCAVDGAVKPSPNVLTEDVYRAYVKQNYPDVVVGTSGISPAAVHPAFYGCYDWHSAVHSHWLLVHALRSGFLAPALRARVVAVLGQHLSCTAIAGELATLQATAAGWEMPYGLAWLLRLKLELDEWHQQLLLHGPGEPPGQGGGGRVGQPGRQPAEQQQAVAGWRAALRPLERAALARFSTWLGDLSESTVDRWVA